MRGSPLIRTLLMLCALAVTAAGVAALGHRGEPERLARTADPAPEGEYLLATPFVLTLSAAAESVVFESAGQTFVFEPQSPTLAGTLELDPAGPTVFIAVVWADLGDFPRFAKLVLEPPGKPTLTHVFDAVGNLSDVWEITE